MRVLKTILIIFASLVIIGIIFIAFLPSERHVERSIVIATSPDKPFALVNHLPNWEKWSPWYSMDTTQTITYSDAKEGAGASYTWKSNNENVMSGKLTILNSAQNDSIVVGLAFDAWEPSQATYRFEKIGENETKVSQVMDMKANGFFQRFFIMVGESMLGGMFDQGLAKMKEVAESMPDAPAMPGRVENIGISEMPAMTYLAITDTVRMEMMHEFFSKVYGEVMVQAGMQELEIAGDAFARFDDWNPAEGYAVICAGFPFNKEGVAGDRVMPGKSDATKVVSIDFYGPVESSELPHTVIAEYIKDNGLEMTGSPVEFYPETGEMDPQNMHVRVCYPVAEKAVEN